MSGYGQGTTTHREPDIVTQYDNTSSYLTILGLSSGNEFKLQMQIEFNEMIESVDTYGGFYIGRYETGDLVATAGREPVERHFHHHIEVTMYMMDYQNIVEYSMAHVRRYI